jgi:hypothetical protein
MEAEQYILLEILSSRTLQIVHSKIMMPVILYLHEYQYLLGLSAYFIEYSGFEVKIR